jgi:hypothetical protein
MNGSPATIEEPTAQTHLPADKLAALRDLLVVAAAGQAGGRVGPLGLEDKTPLAGLFSGQLGECLAAPRG